MADNNKKSKRRKPGAPPGASPVLVKLEDKINIIKSWERKTPENLPLFVMPEAIESDGYYFVAHSRKDFKIVYTDILELESVGVNIWYDRAMEPSKDWRELARRMMNRQECKGVIVYGTVNSMASEPVQTELLVADELGKNIIFINHGEDLKTTAAKDLYDKAKKKFKKCACVKGFEDLLARIGNANITYIDLAISPDAKKDKLDKIKPEDILRYGEMGGYNVAITGVKYLGVKSVKIPEKVTIDGVEYNVREIGSCTFANCRVLERVDFPETLWGIHEHAFFGCESLTEIHLGGNVRLVAENAFEKCEQLEEVTVAGDNKHIIVKDRVCYSHQFYGDGYDIFFVPRDLEGSLTLLDSLKTIKRKTFSFLRGITLVTIPNGVTSIERAAFRNCDSLKSVTIGKDVARIDGSAFWGCKSLTSITIPDSVTSIGECAFYRCTSLTSVTIGNGVTSIGECAFEYCHSLTYVTIPDSVTSIGRDAFRDCISLTSVTIPDSVTSIGSCAFCWCSSLTSITIPDSVTSIGDWVFYDCDALKAVYITDMEAWLAIEFGKYAANPLANGAELYLDGELVTDLVIPSGVTSIGSYAFQGCTSLTSVTIPDSVMSMGEDAFYRCGTLRHVTFLGTTEQWKELTNMRIGGWASGCPCETVKCKDGEVPVTEHDRVSSYDLEFDIEEPDGDEEE